METGEHSQQAKGLEIWGSNLGRERKIYALLRYVQASSGAHTAF